MMRGGVERSGMIGVISASDPGFILQSREDDDRFVRVSGDVGIFLIAPSRRACASARVGLADLKLGQPVDVFGVFDANGCLVAQSILVFTPYGGAMTLCAEGNEPRRRQRKATGPRAK